MSKATLSVFLGLVLCFSAVHANEYDLFEANATDSKEFLLSSVNRPVYGVYWITNARCNSPNGINSKPLRDIIRAASTISLGCAGYPGGPPVPLFPVGNRPDPPPAMTNPDTSIYPPIIYAPAPPTGYVTADDVTGFCSLNEYNEVTTSRSKANNFRLWICPRYDGIFCMKADTTKSPIISASGEYADNVDNFCLIKNYNRLLCVPTVGTGSSRTLGILTFDNWHDNGKGCKSNSDCFYPNVCFDWGASGTSCRWPAFIPCLAQS